MKYILSIFVIGFIVFLSFGQGASYEISADDETLIEATEERIFSYLDTHLSVQPEYIVTYIEYILKTRDLSERSENLFEIIADDIEYAYYLGIYAFDTMTAADCYEEEYFDTQDNRCYLNDDYEYDSSSDFSTPTQFTEGSGGEEDFIAVYTISQNSIQLIDGSSYALGEDIWNVFASLIPERERQDLKLYRLVNDVAGDTGAYVEQDNEDINKWTLTINLDAFSIDGQLDKEYMISTLIHEYAHILTFNKSQVRYYPQTDNESVLERFAQNCSTNLVGEGCLNEDAYLDDFIDLFWTDAEELQQVREEGLDVYTGHEDEFITDYAATNPGEDIAESFAYFVLKPKPTGNTITDTKLRFFYTYKELENLRKFIRAQIDTL